MAKGYLLLTLHAHLPFVRRPDQSEHLEERWLFEAVAECYLPLLRVWRDWRIDGVPARLALSLSPTLLSMLTDPLLQQRCQRHLDRLAALAEREALRARRQAPEFADAAEFYRERCETERRMYRDELGGDLLGAWLELSRAGLLELLAGTATHGLLPLLDESPGMARAQVLIGADAFERLTGERPAGFWLPECAYRPGLEEFVVEAGGRYVILDSHGVEFARPRPLRGVHAPIFHPNGLAFFGRDPECSRQVWSAEEGYPGDAEYREFYRDIGYDRPFEHLGDAVPPGERVATGIKLHRITGKGDLARAEPYRRGAALARTAEHAAHFVSERERQVDYLYETLGRRPALVAPYDAELFGHWWFEGPEFLDAVVRRAARSEANFAFISPSDYLVLHPDNQVAAPAASSWGEHGWFEAWLNGANAWIHPLLTDMAARLRAHLARATNAEPMTLRALRQMGRELLLAQASDWPFMIRRDAAAEYARQRVQGHANDFARLAAMLEADAVDEAELSALEGRDNLFPALDLRHFAPEG